MNELKSDLSHATHAELSIAVLRDLGMTRREIARYFRTEPPALEALAAKSQAEANRRQDGTFAQV